MIAPARPQLALPFRDPAAEALLHLLPEGEVIGLEGKVALILDRLALPADACVWVGAGPPGALVARADDPIPVLEALSGAVRWARLDDPLALSEGALRSLRPVAGLRLLCSGYDGAGPLHPAQILTLRALTCRVRAQGITPEGRLCLRVWRGVWWERVVI